MPSWVQALKIDGDMPEPAFFIRNIRKVTLSGVLHRNSTRGAGGPWTDSRVRWTTK
jgi:hypothetical protein